MPRCPRICPSLWPWPLWTWPALPLRPASCPKEGDSVLILGANGKSGVLCGWEAMKKVGPKGKVVGVVRNPKQVPGLMELGVYTDVIVADCTKPVEVMEAALAANDGKGVRSVHLLREHRVLRDVRHPARPR